MNVLPVARILAHVTGLVNQQLLLKNEYLVAENRILRSHHQSDSVSANEERSTLAEIGKRLGRKLLDQIALVPKPDTILAWYRRLVAKKFDGSKARHLSRSAVGRARCRQASGLDGQRESQLGLRPDCWGALERGA